MVKIVIDLRKSTIENAQEYYEKAKKLRKKLENLQKIYEETKKKLENVNIKLEKERKKLERQRKRKWYEKFRWFFTSNGFLVIAGKDAITNEIIIKKYTEKSDIVLHADIHGSPFGVIKSQGKEIDELSIKEAAQFVGSYSKAWKMKFNSLEVCWVRPEQVSKKAPSGEYLKTGSFMIYGERNYLTVDLRVAIGIDEEDNIIPGVPSSIERYTQNYVILSPGNKKISEISKEIAKVLNTDDIETIQKFIPGESEIIKIVTTKVNNG